MRTMKNREKRAKMLKKSKDYARIRAAIDAIDAGYSLRQVSKAAGIPKSTLADLKAGRYRWYSEGLKE